MPPKKKKRSQSSPRRGVLIIGAFKLLKGLLLLAIGIGALSLLHENVVATVTNWANVLGVDPDNHFVNKLIAKLWTVDEKKLVEISAGTFFYAALMFTEGVGLLLRKTWAEYFTIFATASFMPLEVYELVKHFSITKIAVILVNAVIVWYLIQRVREGRRESKAK
ncbi:MAG: DUF2127 domain-containing protein [Acidobacteriota bacterium]|nr:DUF2127 domain-containing protein [Acidobacteriota bacterium]